MSRIFALLIAIDHYDHYRKQEGDIDLSGCVSDSLEMERYLKTTLPQAQEQLFIRKLHSPPLNRSAKPSVDLPAATEENFSPTREHIIDAFLNFLTQAGPEDIAFIHYSGHGSSEKRPAQLKHIDANEREQGETILCQDSYTERDGRKIPPLRDLEIRWLMAQVSQKDPHIIALMDCCNASGNTRYMSKDSVKVRFTTPPAAPDIDISSFVFYQKDVMAKKLLDSRPTDFQLPLGRHVALYACRSHELAKEYRFPEGRFGVFTYFMLKILRVTKGNISYRDLIKLVRVKTNGKVSYQSPQSFAKEAEDINRLFLGGRTAQNRNFYTVRPGEKANLGILDAGSLHGLATPEEGLTTVSLFSNEEDLQQADLKTTIKGALKKVNPHESILELEPGKTFPPNQVLFKAIVTGSPLKKVKVCLAAEVEEVEIDMPENPETPQQKRLNEGFEFLKNALQKDQLLKLVPTDEDWDYRIYAYKYQGQEKYRITQKDDVRALVKPRLGFTKNSADHTALEIAHIARWEKTKNLVNEHPRIFKPGDVELIPLDEHDCIIETDNGEIILEQERVGNEWTTPALKFKVVLHNKKCPPVFCALLHLSHDYSINADYLPPDAFLGAQSVVDSSQQLEWEKWEIYMASHIIGSSGQAEKKGLALHFSIPEAIYQGGVHEVEDHFKLIISTEQFDQLHLAQGGLQEAVNVRSGEEENNRPAKTQLESLMSVLQDRPGRPYRGRIELPKKQKKADWMTKLITVKTRRKE